jgi:predicted SAM-dependent methyltransferase
MIDRKLLSSAFIKGNGIEIGALHNPLSVTPGVEVKYLDRLGKNDLYEHYPELRGHDLLEVDIRDNGETLKNVASNSQDFIIANHFIEHCEDPILALQNIFRVLKKTGVLYMAIPDKNFTFDVDRAKTSWEHLWMDHVQGPARSRRDHYFEWVSLVQKRIGLIANDTTNLEIQNRIDKLISENYSIHFHVWDSNSFREFLLDIGNKTEIQFQINFQGIFPSQKEAIFILRKF